MSAESPWSAQAPLGSGRSGVQRLTLDTRRARGRAEWGQEGGGEIAARAALPTLHSQKNHRENDASRGFDP